METRYFTVVICLVPFWYLRALENEFSLNSKCLLYDWNRAIIFPQQTNFIFTFDKLASVFYNIYCFFFLSFVKRFGCVLGKVPKLSKLQNCSKSTEALIKLWSFRPIKIHPNNVLTANVRSKLPNLSSTKWSSSW